MNFLNNMYLLPKNFIVANIVEILKEDPDNGVDKLYEMSGTFITDPQIKGVIDQIKMYYDTHPAIKRYVKNMMYNTNKTCLNHFLQNVAVKELWEGISTREEMSKKYSVAIPNALVLDLGMTCPLSGRGCTCRPQPGNVMPVSEVHRLVGEARDLGVHIVVLTGGDPFLEERLFSVYEAYDDVEFIVLTTGLAVTSVVAQRIAKLGNVLPLVILEGTQALDSTTQQTVLRSLDIMKTNGILFGILTPVTPKNVAQVTTDEFILPLIRKGSRLNGYVISLRQTEAPWSHEALIDLEEHISFIRQTRPYVTVLLETNQMTKRCAVGSLAFHYGFDGQDQVLVFPRVTTTQTVNQPLIQVLRLMR